MNNLKKQNRAPLLNALRKAFSIAKESQKTNSAPVDELIEELVQSSLQRRKFIGDLMKTGALISAAGLLNACKKAVEVTPAVKLPGFSANLSQSQSQPKTVIIGAGMAGLNCAYQLKKAGRFATVYEGSKRVGGRIFSKSNILAPDIYTELGGEFIDSGHDDMLQLCSEFGLSLLDTRSATEEKFARDSFFIDGRFYAEKEVIKAFLPYASRIDADINSLPDEITYDDNDATSKRFDRMSVKEYLDGIGMTGFIRKGIETAYLTEYGLETDVQSAINFLFLFNPDTSGGFEIFGESDERYKIAGGNQTLTDKLYARVKDQVYTENVLVKIKQTATGYTLYFLNANNSITTVNADVVVCTIPFSVLRNIELDVALPKWKSQAIKNVGYGTNSKLLLGFDSRVWRKYQYSGYAFTNNAIQTGWDNSQAQPGKNGGYTVFQGGNDGLQLGNGTPESQAPKFVDQLEQMWPGCKKAFNGNVKRMHWPTYPFTLGSYSCYKVGQYTSIRGAERKAIGNLHFAGEHCSLNFQGYMNGAAETGRMAAEEILAKTQVQTERLVSNLAK
ncbi:MAG: NAD(P)/FAD-dependent oxidoreductase [Mucilaginibacter sp.]|uniref:flavin monoamine oxidase family protein n=1 Tax=Mucilaginibacter sp. TaxID=1882438 RepID=UPI0034E3DC25